MIRKRLETCLKKKKDFSEIFCKLIYGLQNLAIFFSRDECLLIFEIYISSFSNDEERAEHVRSFYVNLYKKKIDRILEIESLFTEEEWLKVRTEGRRLDENVKQSLEGGG
jgi:hypothetical protein